MPKGSSRARRRAEQLPVPRIAARPEVPIRADVHGSFGPGKGAVHRWTLKATTQAIQG